MVRRRASRCGAGGLLLGVKLALRPRLPSTAHAPAQYAAHGIGQMQGSKPQAVAHNGHSHARLAAEHSPLTHNRRALWPAVQSNEVYLTP